MYMDSWSSSRLYIIDDETKEPIDGIKLGDLYESSWNEFSLSKFIRLSKYVRLPNNTGTYSKIAALWDDSVITEFRAKLCKRQPINKEEQISYNKIKTILEWIDKMKTEYKDKSTFFSMITKYQETF